MTTDSSSFLAAPGPARTMAQRSLLFLLLLVAPAFAQIRSPAPDPPADPATVTLSRETTDALARAIADALRPPVAPVVSPVVPVPVVTPAAVPAIPVTLPPGSATEEQVWIVIAGIIAQALFSIWKSWRASINNAASVVALAEIKAK